MKECSDLRDQNENVVKGTVGAHREALTEGRAGSCTAWCDQSRGHLLSETGGITPGDVGSPGHAPGMPVCLVIWAALSLFVLEETRRGFEEKWHKTLV